MAAITIPRVVNSAEEWPELPRLMIRVQREGSPLPEGYRVASRVIREWAWWRDDVGPSGLRPDSAGHPLDILLIGPRVAG